MTLQPESQPYDWTFRRVMWATLVLVFIALSFWLLYRFNQVIFMLFIAIVLGTVIRPVVGWLHQRGLPRISGVILVYIMLLALLVGFLLLFFPMVIEQGTTIATTLPDYYQILREWVSSSPNQLIARLGEFIPPMLPGLEPEEQTGEETLAAAGQAFGYLASASRGIFLTTAILLLAFHWTLNGPRTVQSLLSLLPNAQRESISELISAMETKLGHYLAGQSVLCLAIGIMALVAYLLIGLPNALVLALIAGLFGAVPMIGPLLGAIPALLIALSIAPSKLIWVIVATTIIQQIENGLLVPRVMRKAVGVNPFVSLLAIFAFGSLFGIAGALMAIPIAAMIQLLLNQFVFHPGVTEAEGSTGRDYASRLRYETQSLAQDLRKQARLHKGGSDTRIKESDQVMDEIEAITTDLDALLAKIPTSGAP
ncbi:MAG: AI-2E family transporter [Anaerolineales bacterium]